MGEIVEIRQIELKNKKICRFCLTQNVSNLSNIYSKENRIKAAPLPLQVMACVSIEVFSNDCMPSFVCNECRFTFDFCYQFKQMCKKADTSLRHYTLTGSWTPALDHPKVPIEILQQQKVVQRNLNALQVSKVSDIVDEISVKEENIQPIPISVKCQNPTSKKENTQKQLPAHHIEVEIEETDEDVNYSPKKIVPPSEKDKSSRKTSAIKILNKSAIRILNKEAQKVIEPIMSKPVLKRDDDGNLAVVTQILEQDLNDGTGSVQTAEVLETNVFPCPHCERSFPLQQLLDIHMINHNRQRTFTCEYCEKGFFSKYDLQKHHLTHTGEKPFVCVVCKKGFTRSTLLHRHEKVHIDIPKFICIFCEKPFISQEEMEKHTERHRKNRPYVCKICQKGFAFKQGLERHENIHFRQQPFQCQYCDQSFSTPSKLSRHLTAHAGKRPYPCKLCTKSYLLSHHLTRHMRSHKNGSGSYKCNDCNKSFSTRDDLIYHSAVHAAQTMVCPLCKDAFDDIETVTEHVRQHAEGEAYACEFCDLIYMTSDRLEEHIKDTHAIEMVAYHEDNERVGLIVEKKKHEEKNSPDNSNKEIDEVIEEFLYEEFSEDLIKTSKNDPDNVKRENEWDKQIDVDSQMSNNDSSDSNENETFDDQTMELMNTTEINSSDDQTPAKIKKITDKSQETTKIFNTKQAAIRRKPATKSDQIESSSTPKETKKPQQPTKIISVPKSVSKPTGVSICSAEAITRQPTIQAALKAIPKTVSIKKIETPNKPTIAPTTPKSEIDDAIKKTSPRVAAKLESPEQKKITKQSPNTAKRMLRPRGEVPVEVVAPPKTGTISGQIKKTPPKAPDDDKKLVEMIIGDKKVKVKKVTMSKAQVIEMTREGRIHMKGGTMILKNEVKK